MLFSFNLNDWKVSAVHIMLSFPPKLSREISSITVKYQGRYYDSGSPDANQGLESTNKIVFPVKKIFLNLFI